MKRKLKAFLAVLLALTLFAPALMLSTAAKSDGETVTYFALAPNGGEQSALGTVSWWKSDVDGKYYMFMPSDFSLDSVTVWFNASADVYVYGSSEKLENGKPTSAFKDCTEATLVAGSKSYDIIFMTSSKLPTVYINTPDGGLDRIHADKEHKESGCTMLAVDENGEVDYNSTLDYMKGRGNTTWEFDKKPYNIKLDSKSKLFGMSKAKKWCLIAHNKDNSYLRNSLVYRVGSQIDMGWTPDGRNIDLYINGEYKGVYLLCEKVEIGKDRVNIFDLEEATEDLNPDLDFSTLRVKGTAGKFSGYIEDSRKWYNIPNEPENITGGYLLELEYSLRYGDEASGFVTENSQSVVLKSPEYASKAQINYISTYWQEFEDALYSETGYNSQNKTISDYIDLESFAKAYLIQEWSANFDAGMSSTFLHKDVDGKLIAGPIWDFNEALGNALGARDGVDLTDPTNLHANMRYIWWNSIAGNDTYKWTPNIYALAYRHADFVEAVEEIMDSVFVSAVNKVMNENFDDMVDEVSESAVMDSIRWNIYGTTDVTAIKSSYNEEIMLIKNYIKVRTPFLDGALTLKKSGITVQNIPQQKYTGEPIIPAITVKCLDRTLVEGVDYTVAYSNNIEKGTASVTVTGIGDYEGCNAEATFKIGNRTGSSSTSSSNDKSFFDKLMASLIDGFEYFLHLITSPFTK